MRSDQDSAGVTPDSRPATCLDFKGTPHGQRWNLAASRKGLALLFGRSGVLRRMSPLYFAFYRRDFHPDEHVIDPDALERVKAQYLAALTWTATNH